MGGERFYCHREGRGPPKGSTSDEGSGKARCTIAPRDDQVLPSTRFSDRSPRFTLKESTVKGDRKLIEKR